MHTMFISIASAQYSCQKNLITVLFPDAISDSYETKVDSAIYHWRWNLYFEIPRVVFKNGEMGRKISEFNKMALE